MPNEAYDYHCMEVATPVYYFSSPQAPQAVADDNIAEESLDNTNTTETKTAFAEIRRVKMMGRRRRVRVFWMLGGRWSFPRRKVFLLGKESDARGRRKWRENMSG